MRLHEIIIDNAVLLELSVRSKEEALTELVEALKSAGRLAHADVALQDLLACAVIL